MTSGAITGAMIYNKPIFCKDFRNAYFFSTSRIGGGAVLDVITIYTLNYLAETTGRCNMRYKNIEVNLDFFRAIAGNSELVSFAQTLDFSVERRAGLRFFNLNSTYFTDLRLPNCRSHFF